MANAVKPIPTPLAQRAAHFRRRTLPVLVWASAVLACVALFYTRARHFEHLGIAEALDYEISASLNGRLETVAVQLFDAVEQGQVVATLDDSALRAAIDTARSSIRMLDAELGAARVEIRADEASLVAELRRFQIDEEARRLDILSLRVVIESDEVEQERLDLEVKRNRPLLEAGFISQSEFDGVFLSRDRVRTRIADNRKLLAQTEQEYQVARARRERYQSDLPYLPGQEPLLQPLREAIEVENRRLHEIEVQRGALVLRTPVAGQVSQLLCRSGQAVVPGEPIITVTESAPRQIVAWLSEADDDLPRTHPRVLVSRRDLPDRVAESLVVRTGPSIQPLPQRLWRDPRFPDYGRAVVIAGVPALDLTPGELVTVRFRPR